MSGAHVVQATSIEAAKYVHVALEINNAKKSSPSTDERQPEGFVPHVQPSCEKFWQRAARPLWRPAATLVFYLCKHDSAAPAFNQCLCVKLYLFPRNDRDKKKKVRRRRNGQFGVARKKKNKFC